jgi:hypothetical protein
MSNTFQCGDNTSLVAYLYDECEPGERAAIDAHIGLCAACAAEVAALQSARLHLSAWAPPEADLGFAIVRPQAPGPRVQGSSEAPVSPEPRGLRPGAWSFHQPMPVWAQAAAACLIFGVGLSLGILRGTTPPASPAQASATVTPAASATSVTSNDLAALEQRLRAEMAELRATPALTSAETPQPGNNTQILAQVRALIDESEQRQQRELALRTAQVMRDFDSQRRVDLAQIQRNFGQIEGLTGAEVREQRQMLNYLMRVSEQR